MRLFAFYSPGITTVIYLQVDLFLFNKFLFVFSGESIEKETDWNKDGFT